MASVAVAVALAVALGSSFPANAASTKPDKVSPPSTMFSVIGELPGKVGDTIDISDLERIGVSSSDLAAIRAEGVPSAANIAQPLAARDDYEVLATWTDNAGATVAMRWGSTAWGYRKVVDKHNLTTAVARTTTKYPQTKVLESASSVRYDTPVNRVLCTFTCTIEQTVTVRAIVNPTYLSDGKPKASSRRTA